MISDQAFSRRQRMRTTLATIVDGLRSPEYTGSNRCPPCTIFNLMLVGITAIVAGSFAATAGIVIVAVGVVTVWLRGYVVPGTPRITKRYLPPRVLTWFDKRIDDSTDVGSLTDSQRDTTDPTETLEVLGVLEDTEPPTLGSQFRSTWSETAETFSTDRVALQRAVAEMLSTSPDTIAVSPAEGAGVVLTASGEWIGQWPSRTALIADVSTEQTLNGTGWTEFSRVTRADLSARIRGLATRCPVCDERTHVSEITVESCCRETDVVAVTCPTCADRLAEFEPSQLTFAPGQ